MEQADADTITLQIKFKGSSIAVSLPVSASVHDLQQQLQQQTGLSPTAQKLIFKGQLASDKTLAECGLTNGAKIMLIGSTDSELQDAQAAEAQAKQRLANIRAARPASSAVKRPKPASLRDSKYTFHRFEVLPGLPEQDKARQLLERLADDNGIRRLLVAHQWSIGLLRELSPTEHTILGYNRNRGQEIALRLRTDNFKGFRYYDAIKKVLLHELSHMVYDEHNNDFHHFNREITKEADHLDWTKAEGHSLGGGEIYQPVDVDDVIVGGTFTLGGDRSQIEGKSKREVLLAAAILRLSAEEQEITDSCSSSKS